MAKPSKGTSADKRLKANRTTKSSRGSSSKSFGGKKAAPFAKGGGKRRG